MAISGLAWAGNGNVRYGATSFSCSIDCTGANRLWMIWYGADLTGKVTTCAFNSVSLSDLSFNGGHNVWILDNPSQGSYTAQLSMSGLGYRGTMAVLATSGDRPNNIGYTYQSGLIHTWSVSKPAIMFGSYYAFGEGVTFNTSQTGLQIMYSYYTSWTSGGTWRAYGGHGFNIASGGTCGFDPVASWAAEGFEADAGGLFYFF